MKRFALPLLAVLALAPASALADERPYAYTYEPYVSAAGETELELYETWVRPHGLPASQGEWEHKLEIGRGLTERLTLSGYAVFRTTPEKDFEAAAFKLEARYKLLDAASAPLDLVLYLEGEKEIVDDEPWAVEQKLIFGRTHGRFGWAVNLIAEQEWPSGGGTELKFGWNAGASVEPFHGVRLGVESLGERKKAPGEPAEFSTSVGPAAVFTLPFGGGTLNSTWLIVGAQFGLNDTSDDLQVRAVLGCDF